MARHQIQTPGHSCTELKEWALLTLLDCQILTVLARCTKSPPRGKVLRRDEALRCNKKWGRFTRMGGATTVNPQ